MTIKPAPIIAIHSPLVSVTLWRQYLHRSGGYMVRLTVSCGSSGRGLGLRWWT